MLCEKNRPSLRRRECQLPMIVTTQMRVSRVAGADNVIASFAETPSQTDINVLVGVDLNAESGHA